MTDLKGFRREYGSLSLLESEANHNPFEQFDAWLNEALTSGIDDGTAFVLATIDENNCPDTRMLLLKEVLDDKYIFFSNYESHKGVQLENHQCAAMNFYWAKFSRQVRIRGTVSKVDRKISVEYFNSRPRSSQIAAIISHQSHPLKTRSELEKELLEYNQPIECPINWGGYQLVPFEFEFFQGRDSRLHDRLKYNKKGDAWQITRLAP